MTTFSVVFVGILIRIVIPLLVMAGIVYLLRRLDARWQAEAMYHQKFASAKNQKHCWEVKSCSAEKMENCPATKTEEPCWQAFRKENGYLQDECLRCPVFRSAPVLATNH
jgi:hypothetical protein